MGGTQRDAFDAVGLELGQIGQCIRCRLTRQRFGHSDRARLQGSLSQIRSRGLGGTQRDGSNAVSLNFGNVGDNFGHVGRHFAQSGRVVGQLSSKIRDSKCCGRKRYCRNSASRHIDHFVGRCFGRRCGIREHQIAVTIDGQRHRTSRILERNRAGTPGSPTISHRKRGRGRWRWRWRWRWRRATSVRHIRPIIGRGVGVDAAWFHIVNALQQAVAGVVGGQVGGVAAARGLLHRSDHLGLCQRGQLEKI